MDLPALDFIRHDVLAQRDIQVTIHQGHELSYDLPSETRASVSGGANISVIAYHVTVASH